ncbi:shikimate kinase [Bacillus pseudomycoides]|uniref:Shikimate kinase n=1 Tax=Bacillus pseudomycoides TaxID=64104 RepID=A0AA91V8I7_9BACI|nr:MULTISPECIES: shikimate kinase [Bacillus]PEB51155.1 shikimate kinase [Bacillus sp. AFS098217]PED80497.1 shikimate kinase [Bacillus pseudomycoides]PEU16565.1 shikimate kinase [Bacillus sp. AFS019443]PEU18940.1 shikimate kinase [Bacillus sp. AFS014408]PFW65330.1 shikimate kinase [Bacillus sp. AFS075034]
MQKTIILIGPICSGKTSVAEIISNQLHIPQCSIDEVRFEYYKEIGFSQERQKEIREQKGFKGVYQYWKPFEAHSVQRVLEDYPNHVIDFGGGHSVYEDDNLLKKVQFTLNLHKNVFLLLPSANVDESVKTLNERLHTITDNKDVFKINEHFITHKSNKLLAKHVIYTNGKSVKEVADEVIQLVD